MHERLWECFAVYQNNVYVNRAPVDVLPQKPDVADEEKAKKLMAISHANRVAGYLLLGDGVDLEKALEDGMAASDPTYTKRMRLFSRKTLKHHKFF